MTEEIDRLVSHLLRDGQRLGHLDLDASGLTIRTSMHQIGGVVLEQGLNADGGGSRGPTSRAARGTGSRLSTAAARSS